jgi:hypothetical protein
MIACRAAEFYKDAGEEPLSDEAGAMADEIIAGGN